ncbi:HU domain-containing protein [Halocola ammonii]
MESKILENSIGNLLFDHDCVIVPDFGGFVVNYKAAHIHPKLNVIEPPSKQVTFNRNLVNNDALVANYISRKEEISYEAASAYLSKCVREYKRALAEGKRLEMEGIGILYKDKTGRLQFLPSPDNNFLKSSYGLSKIYLQPIEEEKAPVAESKVISMTEPKDSQKEETTEEVRSTSRSKKWRIAAAAVLIPAVLIGGYIVKESGSGNGQLNIASLNPFKNAASQQAEYIPRIEDEDIVFDYEGDYNSIEKISSEIDNMQSIYFSFVEDRVSPDGIRVKLGENSSAETSKASRLNMYFVVGGAFREKDNAENLVDKLRIKGYDASIFGKTGNLHMVCYGSFTTKNAATRALREIKQSENPYAWLKRH